MTTRLGAQVRPDLARLLDGPDDTDADLMDRFVRASDQFAFAVLVRRHGPMVWSVCQRLLRDGHEAEDAFQATFLVLAQRAASLDQHRPLGPWLYGVAWKVAHRLHSQARRRPSSVSAVPDRPGSTGTVEEAALRELRTIVDAEINRLPEKYRRVVVLCYLQGRTYAQAADVLRCPAGTVSARLDRARKLLRDRLAHRELCLPATGFASALMGACQSAAVPPAVAEVAVRASVWASAGEVAGSGIVAERLMTLTEGVVKTMWMTKAKVALASVLAIALLGVGLGGVGQSLSGVQAEPQPMDPVTGTNIDPLVKEEQELALLRRQLRERAARLAEMRKARENEQTRQELNSALAQIEAGLKKLKKATEHDLDRVKSVHAFEQEYQKMKTKLHFPGWEYGLRLEVPAGTGSGQLRLVPDSYNLEGISGTIFLGGLNPPSDGKILKVYPDKGMVLISSGSNQGIRVGQVFRSYRSGRGADALQTAWLEVVQVNSEFSVARVTYHFAPRALMQEGDFLQSDTKDQPTEEKQK